MAHDERPRPADERYVHGIPTPFVEFRWEYSDRRENKIGGSLRKVTKKPANHGHVEAEQITDWTEIGIGVDKMQQVFDRFDAAVTGTDTICIDKIDSGTRHRILSEVGLTADHDAARSLTQQQKSIDDIKRLSERGGSA